MGNPPDKGYEVVTLPDDDATATQTLNTAADNGYQLVATAQTQTGLTRVILRQGQ